MVSLILSILTLITASIVTMGSGLQYGACFVSRTSRGCRDFIAHTTREQCCEYKGFFVRKPDNGQLFLSSLLNIHNLPNCESSCGTDFCQGKKCSAGHSCIMRDHDSICTSDCRCTLQQRLSGPVCVLNGPKYRSHCDLHLRSCWTNTNYTIIPCQRSGCQKRNCGNRECILTLKGRTQCIMPMGNCEDAILEPLCGVDNVTYSSQCHLKRAGVLRKREIHIAYKGNCRASATCSDVQCPESGMTCVKHYRNSSPVCMKCPETMDECDNGQFESDELFCLSIQRQSQNTCYKDFLSCQNNVFIEIIHSGMCLQVANLSRLNLG